MALDVTFDYKDSGGSVIYTKTIPGKMSNKWKRLSTLGHPGTSRPYGVKKLTDFETNVLYSDVYSVTPGQITLKSTDFPTYSSGDTAVPVFGLTKQFDSEILVPDAKTMSSGYSSEVFADTCQIPIDSEDTAVVVSYSNLYGNLPSTYAPIGFYCKSDSVVIWKYVTENYNPVVYYRAITLIAGEESFEERLYKTLSYYLGYGKGNILYADTVDGGWQLASLPYPYALNPLAFAAPPDLPGIPVSDNQGNIILYDPITYNQVRYDITPPSGASQSSFVSDLQQICTPSASNLTSFLQRYGKLYFDTRNGALVGLASGNTALYIGDTLYTAPVSANGPWLLDSTVTVTNVNSGATFSFGDITVLGQATFIPIGEGFYITRGLFNPYMNVQNRTYFYGGGWTVIMANPDGGNILIPLVTCSAEDLDTITPPEEAVSVEISAVLTLSE